MRNKDIFDEHIKLQLLDLLYNILAMVDCMCRSPDGSRKLDSLFS
jgi:hypothetical protein